MKLVFTILALTLLAIIIIAILAMWIISRLTKYSYNLKELKPRDRIMITDPLYSPDQFRVKVVANDPVAKLLLVKYPNGRQRVIGYNSGLLVNEIED